VETRDTYYAKAPDGALIAYQVFGDGPIDIVDQEDWPGNIDSGWELSFGRIYYTELSRFARVIRHDRRGVGLSSRNVALPNLETRLADTLLVMDAVGAERPVLTGLFEAGAPNALLAATRPDRVRSMVWFEPSPRFAWAPDYPWGRTQDDLEEELRDIDTWGTLEYGRRFVGEESSRDNPMPDAMATWMARASRNACTPDVARELARIWYDSDVRGILPSIRTPTLVVGKEDIEPDRVAYVSSLIPGSVAHTIPGAEWKDEDMYRFAEEVRAFAGVDRPRSELDTFLATVLFTDIVGSTERQASMGDHAWKELVGRHHAIVRDALIRWKGVEIDTAGDGFYATFDGPARAIRCAQEMAERVRDTGLEIRAGIHTGECETIDGKTSGVAVSIGARVSAKAGPSEVLVSQTVKDLVAGSGFTFVDAGEHELKGVPGIWRLHRVAT
jgi:class 3 adenylate cyclase